MGDDRPNPEELLRQLKREEKRAEEQVKGKLKVFLGFAAGVGKTYAMLEAAHGLKAKGVDVVCGYIEPHARPDTMAMMENLESIPFLTLNYKGIKLKEFDLDASLERKPQVLLVDELAHTNGEGCRHRKRYQDIEELLTAGIDVYTTVNIQHLESLNDLVESITGIKVRERVPDSVFDRADQVEVVDIEPDDLIKRLQEGKIYREAQAERAMGNFFVREKLIALREIALRRMADRVNRMAEEERTGNGREYFVGEHILTCISASPTNAKVIRTASRLAYAFHGEFTALYVETPGMQNADQKTKKMLEENVRLAKTLGAKIATVFGEDVPYQIAEYAKVSNVSKIVVGRTNHRIYFGQTKGTLVERLTQYAPNLDVYVIPDLQHSSGNLRIFRKEQEGLTLYNVLKIFGILLLASAVGFIFKAFDLPDSNVIMVYILGVLCCALYISGRIYSLIASVLSVVLFNFLFTAPYYSLEAYGKSYPVTFTVMLVVGLLSSSIASRLQRQRRESLKQAYRTELLLENSKRLHRDLSVEEVVDEIADFILKLINLPVLIYVKRDGRILAPRVFPRKGMTKEEMRQYEDKSEQAVVSWVYKNHHRAGTCTSTLPGAKALYLPVQEDGKVFAVVGIVLEERREIPAFEYGLLSAMLNESALVLEKRMQNQSWERVNVRT